MSLPGIGPLPLYGFQRPGMLLFGLVPLAVLAVYLLVLSRRREATLTSPSRSAAR